MKSPLISIVVITYNHESFIEATLKGILSQVYNGDIEVIIADDNAPDNTEIVIKKYLENNTTAKNFNIQYTKHLTNKGMMPNYLWALQQSKGKYIALCEGDDYWTDPIKLQKQVDFLETHEDYNMCVGRYQFYYENNQSFKENHDFIDFDKELTLKDYIAFNFSHTSTFLFRNNLEYPQWFTEIFSGDQLTMILATKDKKIKYFKDFFSVYRISSVGVTNHVGAKKSFDNTLHFLNKIDELTEFKYADLIDNRKQLNKMYLNMSLATNQLNKFYWKVKMYLFRKKITKV